MIYLFNSACRPNYFENVYRLMGMPTNSRRLMRYTENKNAPPKDTDKTYKGQKCTICYVDRYSEGGYTFYPMRQGVIQDVERDQARVYYTVELGQHCHALSPSDFTRQFYADVEACPTLVADDPECEEDGMYCVEAPAYNNLIKRKDGSWFNAVDQIHETRCFSGDIPAFFLINVTKKGKPVSGDKLGLKLKANNLYDVSVIYRSNQDVFGSEPQQKVQVSLAGDLIGEEIVGSKSDKLMLQVDLSPFSSANTYLSVRTTLDSPDSSGGATSYGAHVLVRSRAIGISLELLLVLIGVIWVKEAIQKDWAFFDGGVILNSLLEAAPFGILLWAFFKFRGQLKLPSL